VRVVTPGTVIEPGLLPGDANNYLASVILEEKMAAVAYADITTGEFAATELPIEALRAEFARLHPAEIIHPDPLPQNWEKEWGEEVHLTPFPAWPIRTRKMRRDVIGSLQGSTLEGFGLKGQSLAIRAAGAILQYLKETQPDSLNLLTGFRFYSLNEFMTLDASARRNLELEETLRGERQGSLLGTLDCTVTPMGKRLIHQWVSQPLLNIEKIKARQAGLQYFFERGMERAEVRAALKPLADLERLVNRVMAGHAQPRDLVAMRNTLKELPGVVAAIGKPILALPKIELANEELSLLESSIDDDRPPHSKTRASSARDIRRSLIRSSRPPSTPAIGSPISKPSSGNEPGSKTLKVAVQQSLWLLH